MDPPILERTLNTEYWEEGIKYFEKLNPKEGDTFEVYWKNTSKGKIIFYLVKEKEGYRQERLELSFRAGFEIN